MKEEFKIGERVKVINSNSPIWTGFKDREMVTITEIYGKTVECSGKYEKDGRRISQTINISQLQKLPQFKKGDKVCIPTAKTLTEGNWEYDYWKKGYPEKFKLPYWTIRNFSNPPLKDNRTTLIRSVDFEEFPEVWWPVENLTLYKEEEMKKELTELEHYKIALSNFEYAFNGGFVNTQHENLCTHGFCHYFAHSVSHKALFARDDFPTIYKLKDKKVSHIGSYWFPSDDLVSRIELLKEAIKSIENKEVTKDEKKEFAPFGVTSDFQSVIDAFISKLKNMGYLHNTKYQFKGKEAAVSTHLSTVYGDVLPSITYTGSIKSNYKCGINENMPIFNLDRDWIKAVEKAKKSLDEYNTSITKNPESEYVEFRVTNGTCGHTLLTKTGQPLMDLGNAKDEGTHLYVSNSYDVEVKTNTRTNGTEIRFKERK